MFVQQNGAQEGANDEAGLNAVLGERSISISILQMTLTAQRLLTQSRQGRVAPFSRRV